MTFSLPIWAGGSQILPAPPQVLPALGRRAMLDVVPSIRLQSPCDGELERGLVTSIRIPPYISVSYFPFKIVFYVFEPLMIFFYHSLEGQFLF